MSTYDQIVASAYFVFREELTTRVITCFLVYSTYLGNKFDDEELKFIKLKKYIGFDNHTFHLKQGYSVSDIAECINFDMVKFFLNIKTSRDKFYSTYEEKNKLMIKRKVVNDNEKIKS